MRLQDALQLTIPQAIYLLNDGGRRRASDLEIQHLIATKGEEMEKAGQEYLEKRKRAVASM